MAYQHGILKEFAISKKNDMFTMDLSSSLPVSYYHMPKRSARPCRFPRCPGLTHDKSGYCDVHRSSRFVRNPDRRASSSRRGYNADWRRIRKQILFDYGIPEDQHHLYAVDHNPPYDPAAEPDHRKYILVPRLIPEHNRKTAKYDGGFGHPRITQKQTIADIRVYFGPPCAGKNYHIETVKRTNDIVIDRDRIREKITGKSGHGSPAGYFRVIEGAFWKAVIAVASKAAVVHIPITSFSIVQKLASRFRVSIILIIPPRIITLQHLRNDSSRSGTQREWEEIIDHWYESYYQRWEGGVKSLPGYPSDRKGQVSWYETSKPQRGSHA